MTDDDAHLWDSNRRGSTDAFNRKMEEWQKRDWMTWLAANLTFPFSVTREEDEDDAYFQKGATKAPFRLGHTMEVLGLEEEDEAYEQVAQLGNVPTDFKAFYMHQARIASDAADQLSGQIGGGFNALT